jgi:hypothetical protein
MKKSELLRALQTEIQRHDLSTFMNEQHKVVEPGCPACQKRFQTVEQFIMHITHDVLPGLLDRLSANVGVQPTQSVNDRDRSENPTQD